MNIWCFDKRYYLGENESIPKCNICKNELALTFVLNRTFNMKFNEFEDRGYCLTCFSRVKNKLDGQVLPVTIEKIPDNAIPILPGKPDLQNYKGNGGKVLNLFEAALTQIGNEKIIDNTRYSFDSNRNKQVDFKEPKLQLKEDYTKESAAKILTTNYKVLTPKERYYRDLGFTEDEVKVITENIEKQKLIDAQAKKELDAISYME